MRSASSITAATRRPWGSADGTKKENTGAFAQPFSFIIAEVFKVKDGKLRQIEAVLTQVPYGMLSGW